MRLNRVKILDGVGYYHCICRCVGLESLLEGSRVKNVLHEMIWRSADFSGIQVITYCIMDDHFHLLVRVPPRHAEITDEELLLRYRSLYRSAPGKIQEFIKMIRERGIRRELAVDPDPLVEEFIDRLKFRMHDISEFMKTLKQRFTQWYNQSHERVGTLWTERFKSLIVENDPHILAHIAAYIEMNPVRAGICKKAQDHRWCGIRDFVGRQGIYSTLQVAEDVVRDEKRITYGYWFYKHSVLPLVEEAQTEPTEEKKKALELAKATLNTNRKETLEAMKLPMKTLLMGRLRHLSDGVALGSVLFLKTILSPATGLNSGQRVPRTTGFYVDKDLLLECLSRIRGPKIE